MTTKKRDEPAAKCTITEALCAPPTDARKSAKLKVQQFLPAIVKARRYRKTWSEITQILNLEEPRFHPDSLERAARKLLRAKNAESAKPPSAEREAKPGRPARPRPATKTKASSATGPTSQEQLSLAAIAEPSAPRRQPSPWAMTDDY